MDKKSMIRTLKPVNWIKGLLILLLGVMNSRLDVGIGRFTASLTFGPLTYLLLMLSGFLLVFFVKISNEDSSKNKKNRKIIEIILICLYVAAYAICLVHTILYNLSIFVPLILALLGAFWIIVLFYGKEWNKRCVVNQIITSLLVSFGLFYGALINDIIIPTSIYFFTIAVFALQFSKDIIKSSKYFQNIDNRDFITYKEFAVYYGVNTTKRISIGLNFIVVISMIVPMFTPIYNVFLYFFPMIIVVILLPIASVITLKTDLERSYKKFIPFLLRICIFLQYVALIFASF